MKKIKAIHPAHSQILVEFLSPQEALGTDLYLGENTGNVGAPQGYVIEIGEAYTNSSLKPKHRVIIQGTYIPVPNYDNSERKKGLVEFHNVKAIVEEDENE